MIITDEKRRADAAAEVRAQTPKLQLSLAESLGLTTNTICTAFDRLSVHCPAIEDTDEFRVLDGALGTLRAQIVQLGRELKRERGR